MPHSPFTIKVIELIRAIPSGKVATYGSIATMAGNQRAARQVARILHTCSQKEGLPWHRVINREGKVSLTDMQGADRQRELLVREGVELDHKNRINLDQFLWVP